MAAYFTRKAGQPGESRGQTDQQANTGGGIGAKPGLTDDRTGQHRHQRDPINQRCDLDQRTLVDTDDHAVTDGCQSAMQDTDAMQAVTQPAAEYATATPFTTGATGTIDLGATGDPREVAVDDGHLTLFLKHPSVAQA